MADDPKIQVPLCHKCARHITTDPEPGSIEAKLGGKLIIGCMDDYRIFDTESAQRLCPVLPCNEKD